MFLALTYALSNAAFLGLSDMASKIIVCCQGLPYAFSASGKPCRAWGWHEGMTQFPAVSVCPEREGDCTIISLLDWQL